MTEKETAKQARPKKRKASAKKSAKPASSRIPDAKPEQYFILVTGTPLRNIKELAMALESMEEWVFRHHVNDARNDFSNWIRGVFDLEGLADDLQRARSRQEIEIMIMKYLIIRYL
jgi:hypothetical protein